MTPQIKAAVVASIEYLSYDDGEHNDDTEPEMSRPELLEMARDSKREAITLCLEVLKEWSKCLPLSRSALATALGAEEHDRPVIISPFLPSIGFMDRGPTDTAFLEGSDVPPLSDDDEYHLLIYFHYEGTIYVKTLTKQYSEFPAALGIHPCPNCWPRLGTSIGCKRDSA